MYDLERRRNNLALCHAIGWKHLVSWDAASRTVRALYEVRPEFCHSGGAIAHGGFVTAWLDDAMAQATMHDTNFESNIATLELKVSFLKSVPPGDVLAEGRVVRLGKRVAFLEARLLDASGTDLLATATSTGLLRPATRL